MEQNCVDNEDSFIKQCVESLRVVLPPIFARRVLPKYLGGVIAVGTIANLGKDGPPYIQQGRNAVYEKESFLQWLKVYLEGGIKKVKKVYGGKDN